MPPAVVAALPAAFLVLALVALAWATRGGLLGAPIADDYSFLDRFHFQHPLDAFDSMGATFYWRPLSRQVYFTLLGPFLLRAPWVAAVVAFALFAALYGLGFRIARRAFAAPAAAAIAVLPLVSESARVLVDWPSGAQHLLAMVFAALAVNEALARRPWTSCLALLAGILSHESAGLALPVCAVLLWRGAADRRSARAFALAAAPSLAVAIVWAAGYAIARGHGVALPPAAPGGALAARLPALFAHAVTAQLSLEDIKEPAHGVFVIGYGATLAFAIALFYGRAARARLRAAAPALLAGAAWFAIGTVPLVVLWPDWNAWRDSVPGLGFAFAVGGLLAVASPALAVAFASIKLVALLFAAPAAPQPTAFPAPTTTDMAFVRLARLQHIAEDTREALVARFPTLPESADVHYAALPRMAEVGMQGPRAVRTWYGDSTLTWGTFSSARGFGGSRTVVVAYDTHRRWAATVIEPAALRTFGDGLDAMKQLRLDTADSLLAASRRAQPRRSDEFEGLILANQARIALSRQNYVLADSLLAGFAAMDGYNADYYGFLAGLLMGRGQLDKADAALKACFQLEPKNKVGAVVQNGLERLHAAVARRDSAAAQASVSRRGAHP